MVSQTVVKLRLHIRAYAISYIQDCSATLPPLPDEKKFAQLVREREEERKRRVQIQLQDSQVNYIMQVDHTMQVNYVPVTVKFLLHLYSVCNCEISKQASLI